MILNFILLYYFIFFSLSFLPPSSLLHSSSLSYFTISLVFVQSLVHDCTFSFVNLCIYLSIHVNTYLHTYVHIYMYMHIFILYIYVYIYPQVWDTHTHRESYPPTTIFFWCTATIPFLHWTPRLSSCRSFSILTHACYNARLVPNLIQQSRAEPHHDGDRAFRPVWWFRFI